MTACMADHHWRMNTFSRTFIRRPGLYTHAGAIGFMEVAGSLQLYFQNGYI